jgi:hypothetical protein
MNGICSIHGNANFPEGRIEAENMIRRQGLGMQQELILEIIQCNANKAVDDQKPLNPFEYFFSADVHIKI